MEKVKKEHNLLDTEDTAKKMQKKFTVENQCLASIVLIFSDK